MMELLPDEVIELILIDPALDYKDVLAFGATCKRFQRSSQQNVVLKAKFFESRPCLKGKVDVDDWKQLWIDTQEFEIRLRQILLDMHATCFVNNRKEFTEADCRELIPIIDNGPQYQWWLIEDILLSDQLWNGNLTIKYHADGSCDVLRRRYYKQVWKEYIALPESKQLLETSAMFVSNWGTSWRTNLHNDVVITALDNLAQYVKEMVLIENKNHSLGKVEEATFLQWKENNLTDNQYSSIECLQILHTMLQALPELPNNYNPSLRTFCIFRVLQQVHYSDVVQRVIFHAAARRLGVKCDLILSGFHRLLRWQHNTNPCTYYVDVENKRLSTARCPASNGASGRMPPTTTVTLIEYLAEDIYNVRVSTELKLLMKPGDRNRVKELGDYYLSRNFNVDEAIRIVSEARELSRPNDMMYYNEYINEIEDVRVEKVPGRVIKRRRLANLQYGVGMVFLHKIYNYFAVICGWDPVCKAPREWILANGVLNLTRQDKQPFYNVLVADGSERYVAEENIEIVKVFPTIAHKDIGYYFEGVSKYSYKLSPGMAAMYPSDDIVAQLHYQGLAKDLPPQTIFL